MGIFNSLFGKKKSAEEPRRTPQAQPRLEQGESPGKWQPGDRIQNRYEVYHVFVGGFGVVYICDDHEFKVPVAIKGFKEEHALDETVIKLFEREALEWVELERHQNIVRAYYVDKIEGRPYIFLEYISGKEQIGPSLAYWLRSGEINPKDLKQILCLAAQIANGMAYAYVKRGLIHRDLNPNNILITSDGIAKVTDFGLAKAIGEAGGTAFLSPSRESSGSLLKGNVCGTPPYMPPEQWQGMDKTNTGSDIYSFGCILYEMLSGKPPFGFSGNLKQAHFNEQPKSLSLNSSVPRDLNNLILKCLEKNPNDRYQDFDSLRGELTKIYEKKFHGKLPLELKGPQLEAWELFNKGTSLARLGLLERALECFEEGIKLSARDFQAYLNRGNVYAGLGNHRKAIEDYNQALKLNPRYAEAYCNRGIAYYALGDHDRAIEDYNQALKLDSRDALSLYNRGLANFALSNYSETIRDCSEALMLNPRHAKTYLNRGNAHVRLGNFSQAIKDFDQAMKLDPTDIETYNSRGNTYGRLGNFDRAIEDFNLALELNPSYAEAYLNRGIVYHDLGYLTNTISDYQEFIRHASPSHASHVEQVKKEIRRLKR